MHGQFESPYHHAYMFIDDGWSLRSQKLASHIAWRHSPIGCN